MPAPEDLMGAYLRAQDGYARRGVTTVQEGMMIPAMEPLYRQLCAAGLLKLDVVGYHTGGRHANGAVRTHRTVQRPF